MRLTRLLAVAAIASVAAAPAFAGSANSAAKLSLTNTADDTGSSKKLSDGSSSNLLVPGLIATAVIITAVALSDPGSKSASA